MDGTWHRVVGTFWERISEMDGNWIEWRQLDGFWEKFEEKGWRLDPVKYLNLPPILAELGPLRIVFRYRESVTDECLFEVSEMREGGDHRVVLVWGVPTPKEAEELLDRHGVTADELSCEDYSGCSAESEGLWGGLLPPVAYAEGERRSVESG